jgi:hypothetical protein
MKKLILALAVCAFVSAPAFADHHDTKGHDEHAATDAPAKDAKEMNKDAKAKRKKTAKKGAAHGEAAPAAEEAPASN